MNLPAGVVRHGATASLLVLMSLPSGAASAQPAAMSEFVALQRQAAEARTRERRAAQAREHLCQQADEMDDLLVQAGGELSEANARLASPEGALERAPRTPAPPGGLFARVQVLAQQAQALRAQCDQAERAETEARASRRLAVGHFSAWAAQGLGALAAAPPSPGASADLRAEVRSVIEGAQGAQAKAEDQRKDLVGIYEEVDKATASALRLSAAKDERLVGRALLLQQRAGESREQRRRAQEAATRLVDKALQLKRCDLVDYAGPCAQEVAVAFGQAQVADRQLEQALEASKRAANEVLEDALEINIGANHPPGVQRTEAYRFAKVLAQYPDAKAPFAEDSFEILGGSTGVASLQIGLNRSSSSGWNRVSLTVSAPLSNGQGELFGSADGLATSRSFTLSWQAAGLRGRVAGLSHWLWATSLELGWGHETRRYYIDGPLALHRDPVDQTVLPWKWGATVALHEAGGQNAHLLRLQDQRTYELAPAQIRCPSAADPDPFFLTCLQGAFGPPTRQSALLLGYEYRLKLARFAVSPSIAFNTHSRVTTLGLPIYLVRSADDEDRPLNAGLRFTWSSKGRSSITGRSGGLWSWGVFVGAPFKLFGT